MRTYNEVEMCNTELFLHILCGIFSVAAVNLAGKTGTLHHGIDSTVVILNRVTVTMTGIHQTPMPVGFNQHTAAFRTAGHIEIINPVFSGSFRNRNGTREAKGLKQRKKQNKGQNIRKGMGVFFHFKYLEQEKVTLNLPCLREKINIMSNFSACETLHAAFP